MDLQTNGKPGIYPTNDNEWLTVDVYDDFNLTLIAESGQTFRMRWAGLDLGYLVQTGDHAALVRGVLYDPDMEPDVIESPGDPGAWTGAVDEDSWKDVPSNGVEHVERTSPERPNRIQISCPRDEWEDVWRVWFDMDRSYAELRRRVVEVGRKLDDGTALKVNVLMTHGEGIRILRQDPWETLCTFIISQRRSIPSIKTSVRKMSEEWGRKISPPAPLVEAVRTGRLDGEILSSLVTFPDPAELASVAPATLNEIGRLGYRDQYVHDAAERVADGEVDLASLSSLSDGELLEALESFRGVGPKIASCTGLFVYGRLGLIPVDVWIQRIIDQDFNGVNVMEEYGDLGGLIQQWTYWWALRNGAGVLEDEMADVLEDEM